MERKLHELYGKIAAQAASMIPVKWDKVYLLGQIEKKRASESCCFHYVESESGRTVHYNSLARNLRDFSENYSPALGILGDIIMEVYDVFEDNNQELWEQMSLTLESTGKFNVEFFYDVSHDDDGGHYGREIVWEYETFGYMPPEATTDRRLLDAHLDREKNKPK